MARGEEITTKYNLDVSGFKKGISEANKNIKLANAEFKAAASGMDDWSKSSDGIKAKLNQLGTELGEQNKKLDLYKKQQEEVDKAYIENGKRAEELKAKLAQLASQGVAKTSDEYKKYKKALTEVEKEMAGNKKASDDLKITILNQQSAVNKTERELKNYEDSLDDIQKAEKKAAKSGKSVEESLEDIAKEAEEAEESVAGFASTIAGSVRNGLAGLAVAAGGLVTAFLATSEASQETVEALGKLETAYTTAGHTSETAKKTYTELVGILGETDQAVEAANHLAMLTKSEEELSTWTNIAAGVYGKFGDSLPIEGLTEAANETAKTGSLTGGLADALNWAGVSEEQFQKKLDRTNSAKERATLITNTLNSLYSESAEKYKEVNEELIESRKEQARLNEATAEMGKIATPIVTEMKKAFTNFLEKITPGIKEFVEAVDWEAFGTQVENGLGKMIDAFKWIADNKDGVIAGISGIAMAFATIKIGGLVTAIAGFLTKAKAAGGILAVLKGALAAIGGPATLIIAAIAGIATALISLWKNNEGFRDAVIAIWERVKEVLSSVGAAIAEFFTVKIPEAIDKVVEFFAALPEKISLGLENVKTRIDTWIEELKVKLSEGVSNAVNNVINFFDTLPENIGFALGFAIGKVIEFVANIITTAKTEIPKFIESVVNFFKSLPAKIEEKLKNAGEKVAAWASDIVKTAKKEIPKFVESVVNFFKSLPAKIAEKLTNAAEKVVSWGSEMATKGTEAAKKLFTAVVDTIKGIPEGIADVGKNIVEGLWNGINNSIDWIVEKVKEFAGGILDGMKEALGVASPSKEAAKIGKFVDEGFAKGIKENSDIATAEASKMAESLIDSLGTSLSFNTVSAQLLNATSSYVDEIVSELLNQIKKKLDTQKIYTKLSLNDEMKYWNKARTLFREGTDERIEADSEYFELKKEMLENLTEIEEDFSDELEKIEQRKLDTYKSLQAKRVSITQEYNKKISSLETDLRTSIKNLWNNYHSEVESRANEIAKSFNLFDSVDLKESANKNVLLDNLNDQVNAIEEYQEAMKTLEARKMSDALKEQLKGLNVSSLNQLKEVLSMSDEELEEYDRLYNSKIKLSQQIATEEYKELYTTTKNEVSALRDNISKQLGQAHADYYRQISEINKDVSNAFMTYQAELQKANSVYLQAINELGVTAENGMNDITVLMSDSAKEIGQALNEGVLESLEKNKSEFYGRIRSYFSNIVAEVKAELDINSPSKVMEKQVGKNMILGVAQGIKNNLSAVNDSFKPLQNSADNLSFGGNGVAGGKNTVINFTQNNNSPKALSRQEIYRQTNNALLRLQGV